MFSAAAAAPLRRSGMAQNAASNTTRINARSFPGARSSPCKQQPEWPPARRHSGENLSDRPMEFIAVVLKGAASAGRSSPDAHDHQ
jgi:hypothetical protein